MRIISGKYKAQLVPFNADHIRPTTDRVKESLFNILAGACDGARVLDLFSGTGSLAIEALSRGALEACIVEKNRKSIEIIKRNLQKLKVTEPVQIRNQDVLVYLKSFNEQAFDVIFADPPFTESMAHDVMQAAAASKGLFTPSTVMTIESGRREKILDDYSTLIRYDVREFGDKYLSFYKLKDSAI